MRKRWEILGLVFVFLVCGMSQGWAAEPKSADTKTDIKIVPHRALYKMSLGKVKNGSGIASVSGTMVFDWADSCDGWAIQQQMKLRFVYAEGDESDLASNVVSWESKDGKNYNFNIKRQVNGQDDEGAIFKGRATLAEDKGVAHYAIPKDKKDVELESGTVFPSAHTVEILKYAMAGEKLFSRRVFDGSDEAGAADVSAFIGPRQDDKSADQAIPAELRNGPLMASPAWPVRLAFYGPKAQTSEPEYEMDLVLQANGIARQMQVDYGDFSVNATLGSLEAAKPVSCPEPQ